MRAVLAVALMAMVGCRGSQPGGATQSGSSPESEAPVALNPDVPIAYPAALFDRKIEADVTLRLYVDSTGKLIPESTRVAEGSGYPALDSAALAGANALRFAPAKRHGVPVATEFLQPVEFRQVGTTRTGTVTLPPPPPPPAPAQIPVQQPAAPPPAPPRPRPRPPVVRDTLRADSTRVRLPADSARPPAPPPQPPPPPVPPDTTKARPDTSATAH